MKRIQWIAKLVTALLAMSAVAAGPAADPMHWGDAARGVRLGVAIEPTGQSEFHPGEFLRLSVQLKPERKMLLPEDVNYNLEYYCAIHIVTPDGHEAVCDPAFGSSAQGNAHHAQHWRKSAETVSASPRLRLARGHAPWFDAASDQPVLSLRAAGKYRLWLEFRVSADAETPRGAWHYIVNSGVVEWQVADLPSDKRQFTIAGEQKRLVDSWLAGKHPIDIDCEKRMNDPLVKQILLAKNEGLAAKLLEVLKHDHSINRVVDAWAMLCLRAGSTDDGHLGIDGPYLKDLALWELDLVDGKFRWPAPSPSATQKEALYGLQDAHGEGLVETVLVYLTFHPEDREIRSRVIKQCSLGGELSGNAISFKVLTKLDVLKTGMTLADAVNVLGAPSRQTSEWAEWYWNIYSLNALRPSRWEIHCKLKDGKVANSFVLRHRDL